jgi:hypothetical protein
MFGIKDGNENLVKTGLLELHLDKKGATMNVGMGGADVSLGTIASAMGGLKVVQVNRKIDQYVKTKQLDVAVALRSQYGFGDRVQQGQLWDLLQGNARLEIGGVDHADADAQTKREGDKRVIHLNGYRAGMSREEQLQLGITLAHEAYRNGIDDGVLGQGIETRQAIDGHIQFAQGMAGTYGIEAIGMKMADEVVAYWKAQRGDTQALDAVYDKYDMSADYWRLLDNGSLEFDGDGWFRDVNGNYILDKNGNRIGAKGAEAGLLNIFGMSDTSENRNIVVAMMQRAGMTENAKGFWWNHDGNKRKSISITDTQYGSIYEKQLAQHNPVNIYNKLVETGKMDLNPKYNENTNSWWYKGLNAMGLGSIAESIAGSKYISYEQYKMNNFIQGMPELSIRAPIIEGSKISTLFGARGNASEYPHRGLDFAVAGLNVYPIFSNDTTIARVFDSADALLSPQGRHVDLLTDVTYTFKGEQRTDQIMQRMLHLDSISVGRLDTITNNTLLGVSGNTGYWNGSGYPNHLHTDISTGQNRSPWLDLLGRNYVSQIMTSYSYVGDNRVYYDPLILLHIYNYPIRDNANQYNR